MSSLKLLMEEIRYRKTNFLLSLLAVTIAASAFVTGPTLIAGYGRETDADIAQLKEETDTELAAMEDATRKLMIKMGFNLMIVHQDTNMADFWSSDFASVDMPQEYVERLADAEVLTLVTHLVATLQEKIDWQGRKVLLVGYLPETPKTHEKKKKPMGYRIEAGTVYLGHELGQGLAEGDTVDVKGKEFKVASILPEKGSKEDITIAMALEDAQEVLGRPGRVNQIMALGCRCAGERLPKIRAQLEQVLPETKITEFQSIALARAEQRDLVADEREKTITALASHRDEQQGKMERLASIVTPLVVLTCGVWVGLLTMANVRERRAEIGLLRSLGKRTAQIAGLIMSKAVLMGVLGGVLGAVLGTWLAWLLMTEVMRVAAVHFKPSVEMVMWCIAGAPVLCAAASYLPTLSAVLEDPAVVLRDS